ncbi:MAG TPA: sugar phosphate isomerase/epimerase [Candidatus Fimimorpha excrementavium]|nr:sugar phosphate isomerase/epimerase [Candidatus Fimimorpha excrementavium]
MKQIKIGTCIPGDKVESWLPHFIKAGFETISINFHMTLNGTDLVKLSQRVKEIIGDSGVEVTTLGLYCNPIQRESDKEALEYCLECAPLFGASTVSTFAGAYEGKPVPEAIPKFGEVFRDLTKKAADKNLNMAIENCTMGGTWDHATCNIGFNPRAWKLMFQEVPAENFGLEWEPTHQMVQLIDPVAQLREWVPKIVHMHGKDATIDWDGVRRYGVLGASEFVYHRTPGFGDTNWRDIFTILHQNGYEGDICIEGYHDPVYRDDWEMTGQLHALHYLKWCRGGDFTPNPWDAPRE